MKSRKILSTARSSANNMEERNCEFNTRLRLTHAQIFFRQPLIKGREKFYMQTCKLEYFKEIVADSI